MENKNLTQEEERFARRMVYLEKHDRPRYNAVLCTLAYCHERQGNEFNHLAESLQKLTRGDFKRVIKCLRESDTESVAPGVVDYIRSRWLGKGGTV